MSTGFAKGRELFLTRRRMLKALGYSATSLALAGCGFTLGKPNTTETTVQGKEAAAGRKIVIDIYSPFAGNEHIGWIKLAQKYEQIQSEVGVKITYSPSVGSENPKLLTAIAGGQPPDLAQIVPLATPQMAELGVMTDLTPFVQKDGLTEDDFFPAAWSDMNHRGKVWQLQWDADPNFPFFWNKGIFKDAGLDPEKPPQTIDEVNEYSKRINKFANGNVSRIGMVPWDSYGYSNSIFTWGWAFGGRFLNDEKTEVTPENDYVIKTLEWMAQYAKDIGGPDKLAVTPPNLTLHPFGGGNIAMSPLVAPNNRDVRKSKPDIELGGTLLPYQGPGASEPGAGGWLGGWSLFMPVGCKNPEAAWNFLKWVSASDEGTKAQWETVGFPPAYKKAAVLEEIKHDEIMGPYYNTLVTAQHSRPAIPVGAFFTDQLDRYVAEVIYGRMKPAVAMKLAKANTMKEWERFNRANGL